MAAARNLSSVHFQMQEPEGSNTHSVDFRVSEFFFWCAQAWLVWLSLPT